MKLRSILVVLICLNCISAFAQDSALLELASNNQGFSPPVMSREQMTAIGSPVEGLMVYCSDCISPGSLYFFDGSRWIGVFSDFNLFLKKENLTIMVENLQIELQNLQIEAFQIEAALLECQLCELEGGGPQPYHANPSQSTRYSFFTKVAGLFSMILYGGDSKE